MLWLTKVDIISKKRLKVLLEYFSVVAFLSPVQHCSATEYQFGVFSEHFVYASHCPQAHESMIPGLRELRAWGRFKCCFIGFSLLNTS